MPNVLTTLAQAQQIANAVLAKVKAKNYLTSADVDSYTISAVTTTAGYAATYQLFKGETPVSGAVINIPKDFLVKDSQLAEVTAADKQTGGKFENDNNYSVGDKYIDFVVNVADNSETAQHIYLRVQDLVDVYTAGNGLTLSGGAFTVTVDSNNANGLSVGASGLALAAAVADTYSNGTKTADGTAGAMTSADKYKLDNISVASAQDISDVIAALDSLD